LPILPIGWRATKAASTWASVWPLAWAWAAMRSRSDGDSTVPGQMALQRTPRVMKSAATALVRPMTAALVLP
jgi:predicted MFS family arabinose efflux permease